MRLACEILAVVALGAVAAWCVVVARWCRDYDASLFHE